VKTLRNRGRLALFAGLVVALVGAWSGVTFAAFTNPQGSSGNTITAAPDWRGPTVTGSGGKLTGPLGYIKQGDTVYLFLNVNDTGNPASGVASVTASVTVPGFGTVNMPMTAGSYTVRGQTYNYRSAAQATPPTFAEQTLNVDIVATDNAGNTTTPSFPVVVDNTAPTATNIQAPNAGITSRIEANDTMVLTSNETLDPYSILNLWDGTAQNITVRLVNGGAGNDTIQFWNAANTVQLTALGTVNLARTDYTANTRNLTGSSMVQSGSTITVTLGTPSGATTTAGNTANLIWTPSATATDLAGNAMSATPRTETGTLDRDF
jgi:chitinase